MIVKKMDEVYCAIYRGQMTSVGVLLTSKGIDSVNHASRERESYLRWAQEILSIKDSCGIFAVRPSSVWRDLKEKRSSQDELN